MLLLIVIMNGYEILRGLPTIRNIYNRHTFINTMDGARLTGHKSMPIVALSCNIGFEKIVAKYRRHIQARKTSVNRLLCPIRRTTRTVKARIEREERKKTIRSQFS